jgi:nitric oxide synthase oxygenase domain/subunit
MMVGSYDDPEKAKKDYNVFRDSLLRYMGYANEIGESFRYQVSKLSREEFYLL